MPAVMIWTGWSSQRLRAGITIALDDGRRVKTSPAKIRLAEDARQSNIVVGDYDDDLLQREGTRIAYYISHGHVEQALEHEEIVIRTAVQNALSLRHGPLVEDMPIAA